MSYRIPSGVLWGLLILSLIGLYLGLNGIVMSASFAVAGPAASSDQLAAFWMRVQRSYDLLALVSFAVLVVCAVVLFRRRGRPPATVR
jgi:hypothetical protein